MRLARLGPLLIAGIAGRWARWAALCFHPRKVITTGEGGMITTDDDQSGWTNFTVAPSWRKTDRSLVSNMKLRIQLPSQRYTGRDGGGSNGKTCRSHWEKAYPGENNWKNVWRISKGIRCLLSRNRWWAYLPVIVILVDEKLIGIGWLRRCMRIYRGHFRDLCLARSAFFSADIRLQQRDSCPNRNCNYKVENPAALSSNDAADLIRLPARWKKSLRHNRKIYCKGGFEF